MAHQRPLTPEELKKPPLEGEAFVSLLLAEKARRYPELPPVYRAIADGTLERQFLEIAIKDAYVYWDELYRAIGGIFVKSNAEEVRGNILKKMVNVEGKQLGRQWNGATTPAYEELWLRFAEGLGVPRAEVQAWKPFTRTHYAITTLASYTKGYEWTWLDGIATFYAADLHHKDCLSAIVGPLHTVYRAPEAALEFFRVALADIETDLRWERENLAYLACTTERQHTAARAFRERLDIEHQAALAVWLAREAEKSGGRVPARVP